MLTAVEALNAMLTAAEALSAMLTAAVVLAVQFAMTAAVQVWMSVPHSECLADVLARGLELDGSGAFAVLASPPDGSSCVVEVQTYGAVQPASAVSRSEVVE